MSQNLVPRLREIGRHSLIYGVASLAQSAAGFIVMPLLVNHMTTELFGAYSLLLMVLTVSQVIFSLGISSALARSYFDYEEAEDRARVFSTSFILTLAGAVSLLVVAAEFARPLSVAILKVDGLSREFFLTCVISAFMIVNQLLLTYLRMLRASAWFAVVGISSLILQVVGTWVLVAKLDLALSGALYAALVTQGLISPLLLYLARRGLRWAFVGKEVRVQLAWGMPTIMGGFALSVIDWSDRFVLGHLATLNEVAIYSLSYRMASVMNAVLITPFTLVWNPMMMEYRNAPTIKTFFSRVFTLYTAVGSVALVYGAFVLEAILRRTVHQQSYYQAFGILPFVMGGVLFYGLTNITAAGMQYARKMTLMTLIYYVVAALRLGANWVVIPIAGYQGAAYIALASYFSLPILVYLFSRPHFDVKFPWLRGLSLIFSALLVSLVCRRIGAEDWSGLFVRGAVVAASGVVLLWLGIGSENREAVSKVLLLLRQRQQLPS